jgi:MFS family permease
MTTVGDTALAAAPARLSPWAPLRHRVFAALFAAQLASNIGTLMQSVGSAWLMGDLRASAALVALVQTAGLLPMLLFGIPAGALADIFDRRRLLIVTQSWMLIAAFALAVLAFADAVTPWLLLSLTFWLGFGSALNQPAWQAIQPDLVPRKEFSQAVALGGLSFNLGRAIGPAIGGLVVAALGPPWVFLFNALSFVAVLGVLFWWRRPVVESRLPAETITGAMRAGLRYGMHSPLLRAVLVRVAVFCLSSAAVQALLPTVARDSLGLGSAGYGLLLGIFGIGAAGAAVARPRLEQLLTSDQIVDVATIVIVGGLLVQGLVHETWIVAIAMFLVGGAWTSAFVSMNVAAQAALPGWVRARGMGLYTMVLAGGIALGAAVWGVVATWNLGAAHVFAAIALALSLLADLRWKLVRTQGLDLTPVASDQPVIALEPRPTDGPVLVTVLYRVPAERVAAFAEAMRRVERHRRRTGAYQWNLFRDLAAPDQFLETFLVASWAEHLRQHDRRTRADETGLAVVRRFAHNERAVGHYLSSYSPGALEPIEPSGDLHDESGITDENGTAEDGTDEDEAGQAPAGESGIVPATSGLSEQAPVSRDQSSGG